jgi:hypothetical protein
MKDIEKAIEEGLCCLIPIYKDSMGNVTEIITEDGKEYIVYKALKTILKLICKYYGVDINAIRQKYGNIVNQKIIVPLPLSYDVLLIPFKMRKPIFLKDGSYGYINIFSIEEIYEKDKITKIMLTNGKEVKCFNKLKTAKEHLNKGKIILNDASFKFRYNTTFDNYYFYEEFNSPATKGDIAVLKKEIVEIKETLMKKSGES